VTTLRFEDFQLREGHWVIADLIGKGGHIRTIPVPEWVKETVDKWMLRAGINAGPLLRSINKAGTIWGDGFTPKVIWAIVKANAKSVVWQRSHRTTCDGLVHDYAISREESWNKFSSCWVMSQSRRQSDTSRASSGFAMQSMITSVWRRMLRHDRRRGNGTCWPTYPHQALIPQNRPVRLQHLRPSWLVSVLAYL
jgi:integrase